MSPDELAADPLLAKITSGEDATSLLHDFGISVDKPASAENTDRPYQWSFALDVGRTRLVMLDNRCNRVLTPGRREMLPAAEWAWFVDQAHGDYDHLVVGSSLPWLMPPAIHHLEAWNERLADSGARRAAFAEQVRRAVDPSTGGLHPLLQRADRAVSGGSARAPATHPGPGSGRAGPMRRRPRSVCSPVTCTTRTWPGRTWARP